MKEKLQYETCRKCEGVLIVKEIEILNSYYEVGAYCHDKKCEMFEILIV
jgi:hypothetical protein